MQDWEDKVCIQKGKRGTLGKKVKRGFTTHYTFVLRKYTICHVKSKNFKLKGVAVCNSEDNFDEEIGKRIAFANAVEQR